MGSELPKVTQQFGILPLWQSPSPQPRVCGLVGCVPVGRTPGLRGGTEDLGLFPGDRPRGAERKKDVESARDYQPALSRAVSVLDVSQPEAFREARRPGRYGWFRKKQNWAQLLASHSPAE